jgi:hypothetical protein
LDETHTKWFWCPDRCEPVRNNTGTGTRELHRRAGVLVDVAVKNYKVFKSYNDKGRRQLAIGINPDTLDKDDNSSDAEIETDHSDSEDAATTSNPVATANPGYELGCFKKIANKY